MGNASVQRGLFFTFRLFSLIRHALRRATFPAGEGDLPAGERSSGAGLNFQGSPPHPARATPGPPSPSRRGQEPLIRHALRRATFPAGEDCLRRGKAQRAFSGPCVFWHCMVQCPKIGKRQVERGAFSVQSQDPAGHYGVLCEAPEPMAPG